MLNESILVPIIGSLPVFLEAARTTSFTQASKNLDISQSSVSRHILMMEKYLGIALFERNQSHLKLTEEGYKLFLATSDSFNYISSQMKAIKEMEAGDSLNFGCPASLLPWISEKILELRALIGGTKLNLVSIESRKLNIHNNIDLSIQFGTGHWPGFESILLIKEEVFPVCAPSLEVKTQWLSQNLSPVNLTRLPLLQGYKNETGYISWETWFAKFDVKSNLKFQDNDPCYSYVLNIESAILGKGITLAWKGTVESLINNRQLVELPNMRMKGDNGYYLVYRPDSCFADIAKQWSKTIT